MLFGGYTDHWLDYSMAAVRVLGPVYVLECLRLEPYLLTTNPKAELNL